MLGNIDFTKILFLDIECVSTERHIDNVSEKRLQELWAKKAKSIGALAKDMDEQSDEYAEALAFSYRDKAAIYAEYGKIICISVGMMVREDGELKIRLKSFADHDEKQLLTDFSALLRKFDPNKNYICGHNIKEFDVPYMCRRMVVHQLPLPPMLDIYGKKPWDIAYFLDTMLLWKFGDFKSFTSLNTLTALFGIPSPKDDIDGSQVGTVYWDEDDLDRISTYCMKDVLATAQVMLYYEHLPLLTEAQILYV